MANPAIVSVAQPNASTLLLTTSAGSTITLQYSGPPLYPYDLGLLTAAIGKLPQAADFDAAMQSIVTAIGKITVGTATSGSGGTGLTVDPSTGSGSVTGGGGSPPASGGGSGPVSYAPASQQALTVGPGQPIVEIADAIQYMAPGGTLTALDGTYLKSFDVPTAQAGLTIVSASGMPRKCVVDGQGGYGGGHRMAYGKAMFHLSAPATIKRIGFVNCGSPASGDDYSNEAGIYAEGFATLGLLHVVECTFDNCANGVFVPSAFQNGPGVNVQYLDTGSVYGFVKPNGQNSAVSGGAHPAHDNYTSGASVEVTGTYHYGNPGHGVKSRSPDTNVHDNPLICQDGGRAAEAPEGGKFQFNNNVVFTRTDRGSSGEYGNSNMLGYADENTNAGTPGMTMNGNTLHVSRLGSTILISAGSLTASNNTVNYYGSGSLQISGNATGISGGSAPPGAPANPPALPTPPSWAVPS